MVPLWGPNLIFFCPMSPPRKHFFYINFFLVISVFGRQLFFILTDVRTDGRMVELVVVDDGPLKSSQIFLKILSDGVQLIKIRVYFEKS